MGEPPTDDALVIQESLERPEIFARLYDRHAAEIHRYVMRRLGDGHADDITAQTFLIAFRNRARYDVARASARPWLYGIAGNLIGSHRRSEVRALRALARTGVDPVAESWSERADERVTAGPRSRRWPGRSRPCPGRTGMCCCWSPGRTSPTRSVPTPSGCRSARSAPG